MNVDARTPSPGPHPTLPPPLAQCRRAVILQQQQQCSMGKNTQLFFCALPSALTLTLTHKRAHSLGQPFELRRQAADERHAREVVAWRTERGHRHAGHALALALLARKLVAREQRRAEERRRAVVVVIVRVEVRLRRGRRRARACARSQP